MIFLQGFLIGLSIAAPVGPIGILCINRTLSGGLSVGLCSGVGAAVADAVYGCVVGFGLASISSFLMTYENLIRIAGGLFLAYLGFKTFILKANPTTKSDRAKTLWQDFASTFFLTLANPATILSFIAIYASLGVVEAGVQYQEALIIVLGVFLGSLCWWCILSSSIHMLHHRLSNTTLSWINRLSGTLLFSFGLFTLGTLVF